MGCDIHAWVEVRDESGVWRMVEPKPPNTDGMSEREEWDAMDADYDAREAAPHAWTDRNYALFSVLADVRNYPEGSITPISKPRGIPGDASPEYIRATQADDDGHSHSWLTLRDLLDYRDWEREFVGWDPLRRFRTETIPALEALGGPDDVRMVFFFDN